MKKLFKFLSFVLASVSLAFTPVSAVLPNYKSLEDFKNPAFCKKFSEEFCRRNVQERPSLCEEESHVVIKTSKEEKDVFHKMFSDLMDYNKNAAICLILYLVNYRILYGKEPDDPATPDSLVKIFWSGISRDLKRREIRSVKNYDLIREYIYKIEVEDHPYEKDRHLLFTLYLRNSEKGEFEIFFLLRY